MESNLRDIDTSTATLAVPLGRSPEAAAECVPSEGLNPPHTVQEPDAGATIFRAESTFFHTPSPLIVTATCVSDALMSFPIDTTGSC